MSDTPRTDENADFWRDAGRELVNADFARTLERENELLRNTLLRVQSACIEKRMATDDLAQAEVSGISPSARERVRRANEAYADAWNDAANLLRPINPEAVR